MARKTRLFSIVSLLVIVALCMAVLVSVPTSGTANPKGFETHRGKVPKYVFLFIGDGMSYAQVSTAEMYLGNQKDRDAVTPVQLNFSQFPVHGALMTQDSTSFIPDSASTATSLASGYKTLSGVINMDVNKTKEYKPFTEDLQAMGYKIGIITSVPIDHATPAAFYAKVAHRGQTVSIVEQMAASGFDYFGGGGFQRGGNHGAVEHKIGLVEAAGYTYVNDREDILALTPASGKVVAVNDVLDGAALNYELDRNKEEGELSLADFVRKGIEVLDNPKGYFMMIESGKIDWAGHANDAAASIHDTIAFADAIEEAMKVYRKYPKDTLIVVTADHECGGLSIGFAGTGYSTFFEVIEDVTMTYVEFSKIVSAYKASNPADPKLADLYDDIQKAYGLTESNLTEYEMGLLEEAFTRTMSGGNSPQNYQDYLLYGGYQPLTVKLSHIVNNKAGLQFTSYSHTGIPVPVYAIGAGAEVFDGFFDNTGIYHRFVDVMKILRGKKVDHRNPGQDRRPQSQDGKPHGQDKAA